ncbi:hypothetical protein O181_001067 [Austropuccinia psidii MF-1]|uniref:Uncharacterized protein n=1 Tax=Austropuccinia psidii MF-1 TaxID=1389203 RepID=A0A9Q3GCN7_9BASI|nr:hypothetical protein [Austropuccinia psidii MF-1]
MNVNQSYTNNLGLLTKLYDHYAHFYFYNIFNKQVENGKNHKDNDRRALQESRTKLDKAIKRTNASDGRHSKRRHQIQIKNSPIELFPKAPKGLPLDFYDVKRFNSKLPAQHKNISDVGSIAFLRDPTTSLKFESPDEKMGDVKFTDKNWDDATKDYNLNFSVSVEYNSDDKSSEGTESYYGESVEMKTSDKEEEEYGNPNNENDEMVVLKGKDRETYSKYDEDE